MRYVLFSWIVSFSAGANVQLEGHWVADSGQVSSNIGLSAKCTRVEIIIEQDEKSVKTLKYDAQCGTLGSKWGPIQQDIENGKVFEAGVEVGTIDDTTLLTTSVDGTVQYAYNLRLVRGQNGEPLLQSYYGTKNFIGAIVTEATLSKVKDD